MSNHHLPHKIDPYRSAAHKVHMQGHFLIKEMKRLIPSIHSDVGEVEVDMVFGIDEQDICVLRGNLKTSVTLQCQRCMEPFNYGIMSDFVLGIVQTQEKASELPENYDAVVVEEDDLALLDMIEDELIVSLPIVPMHDEAQCKVKLPLEAGSKESNNPFNVISILRSKDDLKSK